MHVDFMVSADGSDVTGKFRDRLMAIEVVDEAGLKADTVNITLDDRDHAIALPEVGATLDVALGFKGQLVEMGRYVVDELSGNIAPANLTIAGKAADMLGSLKAPKTRAWKDVTVQDIVEKMAGEHGLRSAVAKSLRAVHYDYVAQTAESDLNLLTRLARDLDAVTKPAGGALVFLKRGEGTTAEGEELPVFNIFRSQINRGDWTVTGRGKFGRVLAEWAEAGTATVHKVKAGDDAPEKRLKHRYPNAEEARRAAEAALEASKRGSAKLRLDLGGFHGGLLAEAYADLKGIKPELEGRWLITRVEHSLKGRLTTRFEAERDNEDQG